MRARRAILSKAVVHLKSVRLEIHRADFLSTPSSDCSSQEFLMKSVFYFLSPFSHHHHHYNSPRLPRPPSPPSGDRCRLGRLADRRSLSTPAGQRDRLSQCFVIGGGSHAPVHADADRSARVCGEHGGGAAMLGQNEIIVVNCFCCFFLLSAHVTL